MYHEFKIEVTDEGSGVSSGDAKRLFKPYFQTEDADSRRLNPDSNGFGLAICQEIAQKMGGRIEFIKLNKGSQFSFYFKLAIAICDQQ